MSVQRLRFKLSGTGYFAGATPLTSPSVTASQHNAVRSATYADIPKAGNTLAQAKVLATQQFKDRVDAAGGIGELVYEGLYNFNDDRTNPAGLVNVLLWETLPKSGFSGKLTVSKAGTDYKLKIEMAPKATVQTIPVGGATVAASTSTTVLLDEF